MALLDKLREAESCKFFPPDRVLALAKKMIPEDQVREPRNPNDYAPLMAKLFGLTMIDRVSHWLVTGTDSEFDAKWLARVGWALMIPHNLLTEVQLLGFIQNCKKSFQITHRMH